MTATKWFLLILGSLILGYFLGARLAKKRLKKIINKASAEKLEGLEKTIEKERLEEIEKIKSLKQQKKDTKKKQGINESTKTTPKKVKKKIKANRKKGGLKSKNATKQNKTKRAG